jgi:hypothetical protein
VRHVYYNGGQALTPWSVIADFFFRLFDIWKPFPVRRLERFKGYHGVCWMILGRAFMPGFVWLCLINLFLKIPCVGWMG